MQSNVSNPGERKSGGARGNDALRLALDFGYPGSFSLEWLLDRLEQTEESRP